MGWRFRKSFKILPGVRVNLSKKGISSVSVGPTGAKVNVGRQGTSLTTSIPGTGLYHHQKLSGPSRTNEQAIEPTAFFWHCPVCQFANRSMFSYCGGCGYTKPAEPAAGSWTDKNTAIAAVIFAVIVTLIVTLAYNSNKPPGPASVAPKSASAAAPEPTTNTPAAFLKTTKPAKTSGRHIRGPRGGCYYINSSGNKTYVDRSLCS